MGKAVSIIDGVMLGKGLTHFFGNAGEGQLMKEASLVLDGDDALSEKIRHHLLNSGVFRTKKVWAFAVRAALEDARGRGLDEEAAKDFAYKVGRASYALFHLIEREVITQ